VRPARRRARGEPGCFYDGSVDLGIVAGPRWWHIDEFPNIEPAKKAATAQGYARVIFGRALVQTVNDKADWAAPGGRHLATVGPLPMEGRVTRAARFMEATFTEGMTAIAHRHSGPEAWYVFEGAQCLESPKGATVVRAGESTWIEEGPSMHLSHFGEGVRKSLVLIVHRSELSSQTVTPEWKPKGLCAGTGRE
jgi:quercetin dioxygenase-like cupin family protein